MYVFFSKKIKEYNWHFVNAIFAVQFLTSIQLLAYINLQIGHWGQYDPELVYAKFHQCPPFHPALLNITFYSLQADSYISL